MRPYVRITYATPTDLPESLQDLDDVALRIQAASDIVAWLISNARYEVGEDGYPSDPDLLELLTEATVAQVVFADDKYGGVDVAEDQAPSQLGSLKFDANSASGRNPNYGTGVRQNVAPTVWYMLRNAGLIHGVIQ